jgi:hypothetical protein
VLASMEHSWVAPGLTRKHEPRLVRFNLANKGAR